MDRPRRITLLAAALLALCTFCRAAAAGPIEEAGAAARKGDFSSEERILRPLALRGSAIAQFDLAMMYHRGEIGSPDDAQAAAWYQKAADQNLPAAQHNLALLYELGSGVPKDYSRALALNRKAADGGEPRACGELGQMYGLGLGTPRNLTTALFWIKRGSDLGDAQSLYFLGLFYENGWGVKQDFLEAYVNFNLAVARFPVERARRQEAILNRGQAGAKLTNAERLEAQKMTNEWLAKHPAPALD